MTEIKLTVHPFEMGTEKEAANKVQEEANEAVHAWRSLVEDEYPTSIEEEMNASIHRHIRLADEIADTIQASCNLATRYGIDLQAAMEQCEQRNRARGRYPIEEVNDAKTVGTCGGNDCDCGGDCVDVPVGVDDLRKSPEEMSVAELIEALRLAIDNHNLSVTKCGERIGVKWCDGSDSCHICRLRLLNLLERAYKQEKEGIRCEEFYLAEECTKRDKKIERLKREVKDLTHERDGMERRLEELNDAGITSLHGLLRETIGDAKNITDTARHYVEKARESRKPDPEREAVIERLRELDFTQKNMSVYKIACVVLGYEPSPWWNRENSAELRDKLIELLSDGTQDA